MLPGTVKQDKHQDQRLHFLGLRKISCGYQAVLTGYDCVVLWSSIESMLNEVEPMLVVNSPSLQQAAAVLEDAWQLL